MFSFRNVRTWLAMALVPALAQAQVPEAEILKGPGISGTVYSYKPFPAKYLTSRNVEVWVPPSYGKDPKRRYPVVYMQDGQNVFNPATSYGSLEWAVDETMTRLIAEGKAPEAIIVAIWNTGLTRASEYMPQKAFEDEEADSADKAAAMAFIRHKPISDQYLKFIVEELKPYIDAYYYTLHDRDNTFIMGSSMGGLISLYAICEYPQVFGGAGCISTHWPVGNGLVIDYLPEHLPDPHTHKIYFDHGDQGLDSSYAEYQLEVDGIMLKDGFKRGSSFMSLSFPGETHSEASWRKRAEVPLMFLLPKVPPKKKPARNTKPGKGYFIEPRHK